MTTTLPSFDEIIASVLPQAGEKIIQKGSGRPITTTLQDIAHEYDRKLPATLRAFTDKPDLLAGLIDRLASLRRHLTQEERDAIASGRDAKAMDLLNDEPVQGDIFMSYPVIRYDDETLGDAFLRRFDDSLLHAQIEALAAQRDVYVYVCLYAVERNLRDRQTAEKYAMPLSAVGLMSTNIVSILISDHAKAYRGALPRAAIVHPQPRRRAL